MKTLKEYIIEGIFDIEYNIDELSTKTLIEDFIKENYIIYGKITINKVKDKYIIDCNHIVQVINKKIKSLTNGLFEWGRVDKDFDCSDCKSLEDLKGAPKKLNGSFFCNGCKSLKDLTGAPEYVKKFFDCSDCKSLEDLKGAPEYVGWGFFCRRCGKQFTEDDIRKVCNTNDNILA